MIKNEKSDNQFTIINYPTITQTNNETNRTPILRHIRNRLYERRFQTLENERYYRFFIQNPNCPPKNASKELGLNHKTFGARARKMKHLARKDLALVKNGIDLGMVSVCQEVSSFHKLSRSIDIDSGVWNLVRDSALRVERIGDYVERWVHSNNKNNQVMYRGRFCVLQVFRSCLYVQTVRGFSGSREDVRNEVENALFEAGVDSGVCFEIAEKFGLYAHHYVVAMPKRGDGFNSMFKESHGVSFGVDGSHPNMLEFHLEMPSWARE
ncbi:MAG: hypothetical protein ACXADH_16630, partial [Candidatus Kariarchaeaceae archaeon]